MRLELLSDGFGYVESPRWHDGRLWFSDFDNRVVMALSSDGQTAPVAHVPGKPSGLAFSGDALLVASMETAEVLRFGPGEPATVHADLSPHAVGLLNDMAVGPDGTLFVGCFGYDLAAREAPRPGPLLVVRPDRTTGVVCDQVTFANGMQVSDDGTHLLVAETPLCRVTRFGIGERGVLTSRAVHADLGARRQPDGLCLDAEGGLWIGSPFTEELLRIDATGRVTHAIATPGRWAIAPALGGPDGSTLFVLTAETDLRRFAAGTSRGRVEVLSAPFPATRS